MTTTRLGQSAIGQAAYGTFLPKSDGSGRVVDTMTRLSLCGVMSAKYLPFQPKGDSPVVITQTIQEGAGSGKYKYKWIEIDTEYHFSYFEQQEEKKKELLTKDNESINLSKEPTNEIIVINKESKNYNIDKNKAKNLIELSKTVKIDRKLSRDFAKERKVLFDKLRMIRLAQEMELRSIEKKQKDDYNTELAIVYLLLSQ